jgi:hypothetical protein
MRELKPIAVVFPAHRRRCRSPSVRSTMSSVSGDRQELESEDRATERKFIEE